MGSGSNRRELTAREKLEADAHRWRCYATSAREAAQNANAAFQRSLKQAADAEAALEAWDASHAETCTCDTNPGQHCAGCGR